jgi:nitrite reductase/ring-hydroxylating ferredoxin subunit
MGRCWTRRIALLPAAIMTEPEIDLERVICALHELDDPGARGFTMGRGDWPLRGFVVRRGAELRAYLNHCPHAGHALNLRPHVFLAPDAPLIQCSSHGALFEMETGLCLAGPCPGVRLRPIELRINQGYVLVADDVELIEPADLAR